MTTMFHDVTDFGSTSIQPNEPTTTYPISDIMECEEESQVEAHLKENPLWCHKKYPVCHRKRLSEHGVITEDEYNNIMNTPLNYEKVEKQSFSISGNRIVELAYVLDWAINLQYNHSKICTAGKVYVSSENRINMGLRSRLMFKCTLCPEMYEFDTENPGKHSSEINQGAVWGTLATGSTYGHLEELLSCMDIPPMPRDMFYNMENNIGMEWKQALLKAMEAAGKKEREHALEHNQLCADNVPWISVYVDGSWSKRSYGSNFTSLSGMVGIIGKYTGELLHIAVRNKFCAICTRAENSGKDVKDHVCYKNWSKSAPAMESDMVVEGFNLSESTHGIRYLQFVADGDSSVFAKIKEHVTYGQQVRKVECTNHALKNYGKNLRKIKADTHINIKGRRLLTIHKINVLTKRAKCSIYEHSKTTEQNIVQLRDDLKYGLHHVFGDHTQCREGICRKLGSVNENKVPDLKDTGIYEHLYGALNLLVRRAHLLVQNENNNISERLMNIVARFNMGKRLNLVQRGSYERRVCLAALRFNKSGKWHSSPWKSSAGRSPGKYFKRYIQKSSTQRKKKCQKKLFGENVPKRTECNTDYGVHAEQPEEDAETDIIRMESALQTKQLQLSQEQIVNLQVATVGQFGNSIYEMERRKRLTASLFGRVIRRRPSTPCHNIVKTCLLNSSFYTAATEYGIAKEKVALRKFEEIKNLKVEESGLWVDDTYGFLAASPDGIIGEDAIVEIKCIYQPTLEFNNLAQVIDVLKHKICLKNTEDGIKLKQQHTYYYQIQGQLNITKRKNVIS